MLERFAVKAQLRRRVQTGTDAYNNPIFGQDDPEEISALVIPGYLDDYEKELEISRPEGVRVSMTFYLSKDVLGSLKGALIQFEGKDYRVIGDPQPYPVCPTPYNREVKAEAVNG